MKCQISETPKFSPQKKGDTVDGRNPVPPGIYETPYEKNGVYIYIYIIHIKWLYSRISEPSTVQWIFQVPVKGGRWHIIPPIGSIYHLYTTYILPSGGLYATYHLIGEPETTIEE